MSLIRETPEANFRGQTDTGGDGGGWHRHTVERGLGRAHRSVSRADWRKLLAEFLPFFPAGQERSKRGRKVDLATLFKICWSLTVQTSDFFIQIAVCYFRCGNSSRSEAAHSLFGCNETRARSWRGGLSAVRAALQSSWSAASPCRAHSKQWMPSQQQSLLRLCTQTWLAVRNVFISSDHVGGVAVKAIIDAPQAHHLMLPWCPEGIRLEMPTPQNQQYFGETSLFICSPHIPLYLDNTHTCTNTNPKTEGSFKTVRCTFGHSNNRCRLLHNVCVRCFRCIWP